MKSCRQKALSNYHKSKEHNAKENSISNAYLVSGMALLLIISIVMIKEKLFNFVAINNLNSLATILIAAILLMAYGSFLKIRHEA